MTNPISDIAICEKLRKTTIMTNPIQLLRDFRKWRKEIYEAALYTELQKITRESGYSDKDEKMAYYLGLIKGVTESKKILKRVKI